MSKKTKKADKKTRKTATRWVSYDVPAGVALGGLALVVGAIAMSSSGGGGASGSNERPYVGGDLHSLAVAPENPEKVMVGGHDGAAVSEDGGESWEARNG